MIATYRMGLLGVLIVLWWLAARSLGPNVVPSPASTLTAAGRLIAEGRLPAALADSLAVYVSGFCSRSPSRSRSGW